MAFIGANLKDVNEADMNGTGGWDALEPGEYIMIITDSDYAKNKNGNGHNLKLAVQTADPKFRGAKWFEFLALDNPSADATRIARAKLKSLAIAVNHKNPDFVADSSDLHHKPFIAVVDTETASNPKYGDRRGLQNRIKAFKPVKATAATPTQATAQLRAEEAAAVDALSDEIPF